MSKEQRVVELRGLTTTEYTVFMSGCPQYDPYNQTTGNTPTFQNMTVTYRRTPVLAASVVYMARVAANNTTNAANSVALGPIGFAVNGVAIYNDADALLRDAYIYEGATFDGCRGHASPGGSYHYHSEPGPGCVYNDTAGRHSPLFGVMLDNIPIYGALGDGGVPPTDLDDCGGHSDATYPFYHYHVTYNMTPPYVIKCYRGCVFSSSGNPAFAGHTVTDQTCVKAAVQSNYTSFTNPFLALPLAVPPPPPPPGSSPGAAAATRWGSLMAALPLLLAAALAALGGLLH
ncbi:hypothetical protein GPECTOR_43g969 [Gonium pectorale]|uniref:YHYH domain-containing protein n=1 Tax=Gonium pectorale TaxID=33097 RepID=A0A150G9L9_GONPE|nr:hypothetical protein GPECTOR_43g969 [Gonium pectorale]|eukprot:KXZ46532.1 hypothetical protein GPECTOR_43g969 [Gonium pectorale]